MKKRQANFELLRIKAMCMIIVLHYLTKAMDIPKLSVDASLANHFWWLLYGACNVATNVYVLISGYFLVDKYSDGSFDVKEHIGRVAKIWCQVLFYSWLIPVVLGAVGLIDLGQMDLGHWLMILLPIESEHYWFATAIVMLYLVAPVLSIAVKKLDQKRLGMLIVSMLVVFSGLKSVNPYQIPWDKYGCDLVWFIVLYLIAGYMKMYGIKLFKDAKISWLMYILFLALEFGECAVLALIVRKTGSLEYMMDMTYSYNHIWVLGASVAFFYAFSYMKDVKLEGMVLKLAKSTFGVYLLHEHINMRFNWYQALGIARVNGGVAQLFHLILSVIVVFLAGALVDTIRRWIFNCFRFKKKMG